MEQQVSASMGARQMFSDLFQILKLALTTKFGLVITLLCTTIYFFSLWIFGAVQNWGLIIWILSLFGTIVLSWLTWFSGNANINEEREY